jgi:hypothetical protein
MVRCPSRTSAVCTSTGRQATLQGPTLAPGLGYSVRLAASGTRTSINGATVWRRCETGDTYSISRAANGTITRSCANAGSNTACVNSSW